MKWTTKDGQKLEPRDMTTSHIKNCLAMLKRKGAISDQTFLSCLSAPPNGDMAQMAWEQEINDLLSRPIAPIIDEFEKELRMRNDE